MSSKRLILVSTSAVLAFFSVSFPTSRRLAAASQEPIRIQVIDFPRPVAAAIRQVEGYFGRVVTYEDASYVFAGDIVDVTAQVRRDGDTSKRIYGRRRGSIDISFTPRAVSIDAQVEDVLKQVVAEANGTDIPGDFSVRAVPGGYHVVPTAMKDKNGNKARHAPVLDARITIPQQEGNALEAIDALGQAITRGTGRPVARGMTPMGSLMEKRVTVSARDESARDVLWRVLQSVAPNLSWEVLCDVGEKSSCFISIHAVRRGYVPEVYR